MKSAKERATQHRWYLAHKEERQAYRKARLLDPVIGERHRRHHREYMFWYNWWGKYRLKPFPTTQPELHYLRLEGR